MTTLKASPAASQALYRKKVEERARIVRGRVEALPGAGLQAKMDSVDNRIRLLHLAQASELMDQIDYALYRLQQALQDAEMAAAGQAQDQLLAERGVETVDVGSVLSRSGWVWVTTRKPARLSADQISVGNRYGALYLGANRDTLSTVSANDNALMDDPRNPVDVLAECRRNLSRIQRHIIDATGSERLVALLDAVCGRGETLRSLAGNDDRKAAVYETELRIALDMAGVAFKMGGKRDDTP